MSTDDSLIQINIKQLNNDGVKHIVDIHLQSFKGFFLSFLGPSFLYHYYSCLFESEFGIGVAIIRDNQILGFACGTTSPSDFYRVLVKKKWLHLAIACVPAVTRRPSTFVRLAREVIKRPRKSEFNVKKAELLSICVHPEWEGIDFGKMLMTGFIDCAVDQGINMISLTTDRDGNQKVNKFYQDYGFKIAHTYITAEGRWMNEYTIHIV